LVARATESADGGKPSLPELPAAIIRAALFGDAVDTEANRSFQVNKAGALLRVPMRITGELDLTGLRFAHTISLPGCEFTDPLVLNEVRIGSLDLSASLFKAIISDNLRVDGDLVLSACTVDASIRLTDCHVDGSVFFTGATLLGNGLPDGADTLAMQRLRTTGGLYLNKKLTVNGSVDLIGSVISGQLTFNGSTFIKPGSDVLKCLAIDCRASVFMNEGFSAQGRVRFTRAKIGGQLNCSSGKFSCPGSDALIFDAVTIASSAFFRDGFEVDGAVNFVQATIGANLQFQRAVFNPPPKNARHRVSGLDLQGATMNGGLYLTRLKQPIVPINLVGARAKSFADDGTAWLGAGPGCLRLDGFTYETLIDDELYPDPKLRTLVSKKDRIAWLKSQPRDHWATELKPQPWGQIAKVLTQMGHDDDARGILAYRAWLRMTAVPQWKRDWMRYALDWGRTVASYGLLPFAWAFAGYGYRPLRSVYWLIALLLLGIAIAQSAYKSGHIMATPDRWAQAISASETGPQSYPRFDACTYAFDITVPVVPVGSKAYWMPNDKDAPWDGKPLPSNEPPKDDSCALARLIPFPKVDASFVRVWAPLQTIFGWIFATVAVAGLTGLLRRRDE
jgi:hypothetical protein